MAKCLDSWGKVRNSPESVSALLECYLDISKKGFINEEDIEGFIESLRESEIDESSLDTIESCLGQVFKRGCEVESATIITRWSLFYL